MSDLDEIDTDDLVQVEQQLRALAESNALQAIVGDSVMRSTRAIMLEGADAARIELEGRLEPLGAEALQQHVDRELDEDDDATLVARVLGGGAVFHVVRVQKRLGVLELDLRPFGGCWSTT